MSFLNQLRTQAQAVQSERTAQEQHLGELNAATEQACRVLLDYLQDLARQLDVIQPPGPTFTLDGRTPWPPVKLVDFRCDARRKALRQREVFDYVAMGWRIVPREGEPVKQTVGVNFPTEMRRIEDRLMMGPVKNFERLQVRDPLKNNLMVEMRYEYLTETRGSVVATADHERACLEFRLLNTAGFEILHKTLPAARMSHDLLDELAKRIVGQPSAFL